MKITPAKQTTRLRRPLRLLPGYAAVPRGKAAERKLQQLLPMEKTKCTAGNRKPMLEKTCK
jgi:hypothetical protein